MHMVQCFELSDATMFPTLTTPDLITEVPAQSRLAASFSVICRCRMPLEPGEETWTCPNRNCGIGVFHGTCIDRSRRTVVCPECVQYTLKRTPGGAKRGA